MADENELDYAIPAPPPVKWGRIVAPLVMATAPIVLALCGFAMGYVGMIIAAPALCLNILLAPVSIICASINFIAYRRDQRAFVLSLTTIGIAALTLLYAMWRSRAGWD